MDLFNLPGIPSTQESDKLIANKITKKPTKIVAKAGMSLSERISNIKKSVEENLGEYKDKYECIRDNMDLHDYITSCILNGVCAIDTETTGLNPMLDEIVGFSLYTPGEKAVYIPINHIDYITNQKVSNQLPKDFIKGQLQRLVDNNVKLIMFNAKFDIRVIRHQIGVYLTAYWDGYIAQRLLNENEENNRLKPLHTKYILKNSKDAFSFSDFFEDMNFSLIPISSAYIYAARDSEITYELYKYQEQFLDKNSQKCIDKDLIKVSDVFREIEMPLINVVADMEDSGIAIDLDYTHKLSEKYHKLLIEKEAEFYALCDKYNDKIEAYRQLNPNNKLGSLINISSPLQIAILMYDILGEKDMSKKSNRSVDDKALKSIDNEFSKVILEYRGIAKLLSTYIDKMEKILNSNDNKVHCSFNQYGAKTGRFSSDSPNMQNIPSHNKDIRKMFVADEGYCLISTDYSQQEMRILAHATQDKNMIKSYNEGKDLYTTIASIAFNTTYNECLEHFPKDTKIKEKNGKWYYAEDNDFDKLADGENDTYADGKERRNQAKAITLGVCYGKGIPAIAEDLGITKQHAQEVYDSVMGAFPVLKQYMEDSQNMAREKGFVDTIWGRKRRLPNMQLDPYEFDFSQKQVDNFDPLSFDNEIEEYIDYEAINKYTKLLNKAYGLQAKEQIKVKANQEGIIIKDNNGYIAEATRQCVNSRIQGSAGDLIKKAMILIANDKKLKQWNCKILLQVHDELISTCPIEYAKQCSERLCYLMGEAGKGLAVEFKSDAEVTKCWYGEKIVV